MCEHMLSPAPCNTYVHPGESVGGVGCTRSELREGASKLGLFLNPDLLQMCLRLAVYLGVCLILGFLEICLHTSHSSIKCVSPDSSRY